MKNNQKGFTILELMIASTVFSVIMLVCLSAFVQIGRMYYKGITMSRTQQTARTIIDDISREIQFSNADVTYLPSATTPTICVGNKHYSFNISKELSNSDTNYQTKHGLYREEVSTSGCTVANPDFSTELLSDGMQVDAFSVTQKASSGSTRLWTLRVKVVSGSNSPTDAIVEGASGSKTCVASGGSQFCAVSDLTTSVVGRL